MLIPVVLSGGSGTRLWPVSRTKLPKQFAHIFERSLQEMTLSRLSKVGSPWIVANAQLQELTVNQAKISGVPVQQLLFEPQSKNTAPAIALICKVLQSLNLQSQVVGVFPSDHLIENESAFFSALRAAEKEAQTGRIVTLGIAPTFAATGYGYIQTNKISEALAASPVQKFHEKPDLGTAESFLKSGNFFWNAGIFVFKVDTMIAAFDRLQPRMWSIFSRLKEDLSNLNEIFSETENISIDYAILEKLNSKELSCVPCDIGWNDIGSWDAIAAREGASSEIVQAQATGNFVHGLSGRTYAFAGVNDLIVVDTKDALLITCKGKSQTVKDVVEVLKLKNGQILQEPPPEESL